MDEIFTGTAADGAFAQNDSLPVDPAILAIEESTTPVTPGPSTAEGTTENAVKDIGMEDSLGVEDMNTELSSDPFESRPLTNKAPLKRVRASTASEKKTNKRTVPGAIGEMIDILKQEKASKG